MAKTKKRITPQTVRKIILYSVLILISAYIVLPFYVMLISSMQPKEAFVGATAFSWWPKDGFDFDSYVQVFNSEIVKRTANVLQGVANSFLIYLPSVVIGMFVSGFAAYGFAKLEFRGKNAAFALLLTTMTLPATVTLSSSYLMFTTVYNWGRTPLPLMVPRMFGTTVAVFFIKQFLSGVSNSLMEAARIDGMNEYQIFFNIILPLIIPAIFAQMLISFIGVYNDYLLPLLYLQSTPELYTAQISLKVLEQNYGWKNRPVVMAGCVISVAPLMLLFIIFQKRILSGISMSSGLKG